MLKYFKILAPLLLFCAGVFGQGKPINVYRSAPSVTVNDAYLHAYKGFTLPIVPDTTTGINGSLDSIGQLIYVKANGKIYQRDSVPTGGHVWTAVGTGTSGGGSDSGIVQGVGIIVNRVDATHRIVGTDTFHVIASQWLAQHKVDSLSAALNTILNTKVTNFAGVSFWGYGLWSTKPTTGAGLYTSTGPDSVGMFYINGATVTRITADPNAKYHVGVNNTGSGYPLVSAVNDTTLAYKSLRNGRCIVIDSTTNPGEYIIKDTCTLGSGTTVDTGLTATAPIRLARSSTGPTINTTIDTVSAAGPGVQQPGDYTTQHTPIYPKNDSVGGLVDSSNYFDRITNQWHFKGRYNRYGHKPFSTQLVNYDDIDTSVSTGLPSRYQVDTAKSAIRAAIAAGGTSVANSTATIGVTRVTGTATTAKRSDAADPIDTTATGVPAYHNITDTARVLRQAMNAVYPNESQVGDIFNAQTFQNSLTSFGTANSSGSATVTLSSGYPVITTTSSASWFSTITQMPDRPTMLPLWSDTLEFQLLFTPGAGTTGMGPALISNQATSPLSLKGYLNTSNSGNGNIVMATHAGVVLGSGGTGCTNTLNDVIRTVLTKVNDSTFTFQAFNLTTQAASTLATANFVTTLGGNLPPNIANWGYVAFGTGTYRILRRHIVSTAKRYPYVANAMNSKGVSVGASKFGLGIGATLGRSFVSTLNYSGAGSTAADFLKLKTEMLMLDPAYVTFGYYSNDLRFGATLAQTESLIITAASWWKGTGTKFIVTAIPEDSTAGGIGMTNIKNWMASSANQAAYGFVYVDSWTTLTGGSGNICVSPYINTDHIHLTDAGYAAVASLLSAAIGVNPVRRASPRTYSPTLVSIGDSLTTTYSVTNRIGYVPVPDSNLNLVPSFFQQNGSQAGVSASGSYIPAFGSTFGVNGQIGTNGPSGGFSFYDRSVNATFGSAYGLYCDKNLLRFFTNALSGRDFALMDSAGRIKFGNFTAGIQTVRPSAWVDVPASDGAAGHGSFIIPPGKKLITPLPGVLDNDSTADHIYWTGKTGTQYQLDQQSGASAPFADNVAIIKNNADATKTFKISAAGITTATARTMTVPDFDFTPATLAHSQTFSGSNNTFNSSIFYVNGSDIELNSGSAGTLFVTPVSVAIGGGVTYSSLSFTASFTINTTNASYSASFITCGTLSGAGVITLPSSGDGGRTYKLVNANNTTNAWTFAGATLKDGFGNTVTSFPNGYTYEIYFNGSTWDIKSVSYTGAAPGVNRSVIVASSDLAAQTSAGTVLTFTPSVTSTYRVGGYAAITAISANTLNVFVSWTDENGTGRSYTLLANTGATGYSPFSDIQIRAQSGSAITISTNVVGAGSQTYDAGATIEKIR